MPPVAADFQKYKITVQIMTKQEILEREDAQSTTIHLYKEGIFWKAYEYSAYRFVFGILKCKPKKQRFKETSTEMIHIGFPLTSLDTHQDSFRLISKDENTCTIEPVDFLPQMTFEEWKNSIAQLEFEKDAEHNLIELYHELLDGSYVPGKSICFLTHFPVLIEVFASQVPQYSSTSISQVVTKSPSHISDTPTREEKGAR